MRYPDPGRQSRRRRDCQGGQRFAAEPTGQFRHYPARAEPAPLRHPMALKPAQPPAPAVLSRVGTIARAIIGVEGARGVRVDHDVRGATGGLKRAAHPLHVIQRNRRGLSAVQPQHRRFQRPRHVERIRRLPGAALALQPAVPGPPALKLRRGWCAAYSQTIRPPQQKPVIPNRPASP